MDHESWEYYPIHLHIWTRMASLQRGALLDQVLPWSSTRPHKLNQLYIVTASIKKIRVQSSCAQSKLHWSFRAWGSSRTPALIVSCY